MLSQFTAAMVQLGFSPISLSITGTIQLLVYYYFITAFSILQPFINIFLDKVYNVMALKKASEKLKYILYRLNLHIQLSRVLLTVCTHKL